MGKKYNAIVMDTKDPENKGRVKVKITEIHDVNIKKEDLIWSSVRPSAISSGGIGEKKALQVNQWVTVEDVSGDAGAVFEIVSGSGIVDSEHQDENDYSYNKDVITPTTQAGDSQDDKPFNWNIDINKALSKTPFPKIFSADPGQLKNTLDKLINSELLNITMGAPGPTPPAPPPQGYPITANLIDFTNQADKLVDIFGKEIQLTSEYFWYTKDGFQVPCTQSNTKLELLPGSSGYPGDMVGYLENGDPAYIELDGWNLVIPPNAEYSTTGKEYTISYKLTDLSNLANTASNVIKIKYYDKAPVITVTSPEPVATAVTPQYKLDERKSESDKGNPEDKSGVQLANGLSYESDSSSDNAYHAIKHPSGSRQDMLHDGTCVYKSKNDTQIISEKNMHFYSQDQINMASTEHLNVKSPQVYFECNKQTIDGDVYITGDTLIDGNLHVKGDVYFEKTLTVDGDINAKSNIHCSGIVYATDFVISSSSVGTSADLSMGSHVHTEQGDGNDTSGPHA